MTRIILRIVLIAGLLVAGWSAGKAQTTVADFELSVRVANGKMTLICGRGCDWPGATPATISVDCTTNAPCRGTVTGHGLVNGLQMR
jgi:hypothetical protein